MKQQKKYETNREDLILNKLPLFFSLETFTVYMKWNEKQKKNTKKFHLIIIRELWEATISTEAENKYK